MTNNALQKYLQYSKRIAIFGIAQWAILALASLMLVLLSSKFNIFVDEWTSRVINNIVTCSSALSVAICSGYYAHSAYDNSLKQKVSSAILGNISQEEEENSSGNG